MVCLFVNVLFTVVDIYAPLRRLAVDATTIQGEPTSIAFDNKAADSHFALDHHPLVATVVPLGVVAHTKRAAVAERGRGIEHLVVIAEAAKLRLF